MKLTQRTLYSLVATQTILLVAAAGVICFPYLLQFILGHLGMPRRYYTYPELQVLNKQTSTQRFPQFDNEDVKVWRSVVLPNQPLNMHRHDHPRVIIPLRGGTMKIVDSTGATEVNHWEVGHAYWLPANPPNTTHADVNGGTEPIEVMVVSLEKEK